MDTWAGFKVLLKIFPVVSIDIFSRIICNRRWNMQVIKKKLKLKALGGKLFNCVPLL